MASKVTLNDTVNGEHVIVVQHDTYGETVRYTVEHVTGGIVAYLTGYACEADGMPFSEVTGDDGEEYASVAAMLDAISG